MRLDTIEDLVDDIEPILSKNPGLIIIYFGTNDITSIGVSTKENCSKKSIICINMVHKQI